ncbi:MAG: hypothetical protein ACOYOK_05190 [Pseudobdellovibrionaceae bacterium]
MLFSLLSIIFLQSPSFAGEAQYIQAGIYQYQSEVQKVPVYKKTVRVQTVDDQDVCVKNCFSENEKPQMERLRISSLVYESYENKFLVFSGQATIRQSSLGWSIVSRSGNIELIGHTIRIIDKYSTGDLRLSVDLSFASKDKIIGTEALFMPAESYPYYMSTQSYDLKCEHCTGKNIDLLSN